MRVDQSLKYTLSRAAYICNKSVSDFVRSAALVEAERVLEKEKVIELSLPAFIELSAVLSDQTPNKALQKAFKNRNEFIENFEPTEA